jgi:hypothetical protein
MLVVQGSQMIMTNFHRYRSTKKAEDDEIAYKNFQFFNAVSSSFGTTFTITTCLLIFQVFENRFHSGIQCFSLFVFHYGSLFLMNYDTNIVNYQSTATIVIAVFYLLILVPFFAAVLVSLQNEVNKEIIFSFSQKN